MTKSRTKTLNEFIDYIEFIDSYNKIPVSGVVNINDKRLYFKKSAGYKKVGDKNCTVYRFYTLPKAYMNFVDRLHSRFLRIVGNCYEKGKFGHSYVDPAKMKKFLKMYGRTKIYLFPEWETVW